jgi:hypothetical protein
MTIQLIPGYVGITREGNRVEITECLKDSRYPWSDGESTYRDNGTYHWAIPHNKDIVGPWVEPTNYNDGKWHRWSGGKCPLYPKTRVEAILTRDVKPVSGMASAFTWDHENDPILAFRVTEEYVEPQAPRELWVSLNDYQGHETEADAQEYDINLGSYHGYIHVREVI